MSYEEADPSPMSENRSQINSCYLSSEDLAMSVLELFCEVDDFEHSRHRSPTNFVVHLIAGLIAYSHQNKKPSLHLDERSFLAA